MRRAILLLTLTAGAGAFAACGGGSRAAHGGGATAGSAVGRGAKGQLTRTIAAHFARAVNLRATDVPGLTPSVEHHTKTRGQERDERVLQRCMGPPDVGPELFHEGSPSFKVHRNLLDLGVSSEVNIQPTAASAARELTAIQSARARRCVSHYFQLLLRGLATRGRSVGHVTIQSGRPPAPGMAGSFGWRIKANVLVGALTVPFYVDLLGFVDGPARVTLFSTGALRPFPASIQQRLFSLLLTRARGAQL